MSEDIFPISPRDKASDLIEQCCVKLRCLPEDGRKAATMVVDEILAIPEHRTLEYDIMVGVPHKHYVQAMSPHERKYWQAVKQEIENKL